MTTSDRPRRRTAPREGADLGLFGPDSVTWRIHGDPAMAVAGYRALLLQATHPLVMAGFDDNSDFRQDPWGRLQRTGEWVATVTYGTTEQAERAGARLRRLHASLAPGVEPETGLSYRVDDPDLLRWVHCTEVDSFLTVYRRSGPRLSTADADRYVDEMRTSARLVGLDPATVPHDLAGLRTYLRDVRPQLRLTRVARRNVVFGFVPPMPGWVRLATPARPAWIGLMTLALALLPPWARRLYGLPGLPTTDVGAAGMSRVLRHAVLALPADWRRSPVEREARQRAAGTVPVAA